MEPAVAGLVSKPADALPRAQGFDGLSSAEQTRTRAIFDARLVRRAPADGALQLHRRPLN